MRAEKKEPAIEDLLRAWGLMRVPFAPDEKDTFPARSHQELLPLLDTTAALRGVMALTGSPGTGKSTLLKSWLRGLDPKRHLPAMISKSDSPDSPLLLRRVTSFSSSCACAARSRPRSNTPAADSRTCPFHCVTCTGCRLFSAAICCTAFNPLSASSAIRALNSALWFLLFCFMSLLVLVIPQRPSEN